MSNDLYSRLAWLPAPPDDFSAQCRQLRAEPAEPGRRIQHLARHGLDENQLNRLSKVIETARNDGKPLAPLIPVRLGIISNATTHFLAPVLVATAARHGIALECIEANFDQVMQEALSADSEIARSRPDIVLVALDHRGLPLHSTPGNAAAATQSVADALKYLRLIRDGLRNNSNAVCILQTVVRPVETSFGSLDFMLPGTPRGLVDAFNRGLAENLAGTQDLLLDVAAIAETVGLSEWHDAALWNMAKVPFSNIYLPLYADHVCRLIAAQQGKSRRCLILDLDNTLWGGVIGDDGLEGIVLGQGDATGEAFLDTQRTALALRERGVVLAVSSKNNDEMARLPFQNHPEMLLRESHIAVFQANWNDKATNIQAIAKELSLGLESMVFLDDNPVERGLVRKILPDVAVPELPEDPALHARTLLAAGYFEAVAYSAEDRQRAGFYQDNARRVALLLNQAGDMDAYLDSLNMTITFQPFDEIGRARISQLINKSNQFNLTTRLYTELEVAKAERDPDCFTLQMRLSDTFGDNGMISVVICRSVDEEWHVDTWLMSCRVLGRKVEHAVLQELVMHARTRGVRRIQGIYLPTERNKLVADHYSKLGFTALEQRADAVSIWQLDVAGYVPQILPMSIVRSDAWSGPESSARLAAGIAG